jgi:hypothetical protein
MSALSRSHHHSQHDDDDGAQGGGGYGGSDDNDREQDMNSWRSGGGDAADKDDDDHHHHKGFAVAVTKSTYLFVMCAAINSCNLGFDIGVSTEAAKLIQKDLDLTNFQRELLVGSINFWASRSNFGALV